MKILFTGGGTGGHILPLIAIVREIRRIYTKKDLEFYYLGPKDEFSFILLSQEDFVLKNIISGKMTFKEIMAIEISDKKTVALKYNPQAILNEGAKLVHKDNRNNELYLIENKEINKELEEEKIWFLKMLCPTGRIFIEGVDPKEAEKNPNATYLQAIACGLTLQQYLEMEMES